MDTNCKTQRLIGKVAIITAATKGIGFAIAERFLQEGATVVISSRHKYNIDEAITQLQKLGFDSSKIFGCVCHVGNATDRKVLVQKTLEKFHKIDILINNAGINPIVCDIMDVNEKTWDKMFDINLKAGFLLTKLVVPHMIKIGGGNIVFNASITGYLTPYPLAVYGVTKTSILGLTKALALSLSSKNIRVNCISPGIIKTSMSEFLWKSNGLIGNNQEIDIIKKNPINRIGEPHECASVVAFLVSNDASYITGENIVVAGGEYCRL